MTVFVVVVATEVVAAQLSVINIRTEWWCNTHGKDNAFNI